jgi:hypothetical protein
MTDDQEHARVRTVLDDMQDANDARYAEWLKTRKPGDTDPRIENGGKPLRIRGMIDGDGKLVLPGEEGEAR